MRANLCEAGDDTPAAECAVLCAVRTGTENKMTPRLTQRNWPEAALWMTPTFSVQLASQWAPCCFFPRHSLCFYMASLLCPPPPTPSEPPDPECGKTTNPNSGYKLQTCLWPGSACSPLGELLHRHHCPHVPSCRSTGRHDPNFTLPTCPLDDSNGTQVLLVLHNCCL